MKLIPKVRSFKIIVVTLLLATLSAGCGGSGKTAAPVTLKIWKPFADSGQMQPLLTAYQQIHPNVQFEYTKKNIDNYEGDLLNSLAAGNGPDIFSINNSWLPKYLDKTYTSTR